LIAYEQSVWQNQSVMISFFNQNLKRRSKMKNALYNFCRTIVIVTALCCVLVFILAGCSKKKSNPVAVADEKETIKDVDGNAYTMVKIGKQTWMVENLKVTHYRNGDVIPIVTDSTVWKSLKTGAYCSYANDKNNGKTYGYLYNWYAVKDSRGLAPVGWHTPSNAEWQTLTDYLGGAAVAGGKLKDNFYGLWKSPNTGATNESGFSALPAGWRENIPDIGNKTPLYKFTWIGLGCGFWSSADTSDYAYYTGLMSSVSEFYPKEATFKEAGYSVRCIKD
jgi:uncharacterized protein (TIGR02145 family)